MDAPQGWFMIVSLSAIAGLSRARRDRPV